MKIMFSFCCLVSCALPDVVISHQSPTTGSTRVGVAHTGNLRLDFMVRSVKIVIFGGEINIYAS